MNIAKLMKQAQQMQAEMQKVQSELAQQTFESSSGGGAVKAKASGEGKLLEIKISPEILKDGDVQMIEDLVLTAVNSAVEQGKDHAQKRLGSVTGGLGIPGLG